MKTPSSVLVAGLCLLSSAPCQKPGAAPGNIVEVAKAAGSFKTLVAAVGAAGLAGVLTSDGPFTVFAPTDEAFAKLPKGTIQTLLLPVNRPTLVAILKHHVLAGRVTASEAVRAARAETLGSTTVQLRIQAGQLRVDNAKVIDNDIRASNGIIHAIDTVLLPKQTAANAVLDTSALGLIVAAVDKGVPLFNAGQEAACAAIYEVAVRGLIGSREVTASLRKSLTETLRKSAGESRTDAAWTLRAGLDKAAEQLERAPGQKETKTAASAAPQATKSLTSRGRPVFDFNDEDDTRRFRIVNDSVMGGRSRSKMASGSGIGVFSGVVSLENNGGFASVRASIPEGTLAGAEGLILRVKGDGRTYRLTARQGRQSFDQSFETKAGVWQEVRVPLSGMRRNWRGFRPGGGPPTGAKISGLGILIGDKRAGDFRLEVDWIRSYGQAASSRLRGL